MKRFIVCIITIIGALCVTATPRLTVIVTVDGLHQQDLSRLRSYWPQGGMRTLSEEAFQTEVAIPHLVYGGSESVATLLTGTTPLEHGISMDQYFSRSDRSIHSIFEDGTQKGIGTQLKVSPANILSMTITDRFRLSHGEKAQIYAIGIDPYTTLCMAGHSANACCWFDAKQLRWVTTTFYDEGLPSVADKMNTSGRLTELNAKLWEPRMDIAQYIAPTDHEKKKSFSYTGFQDGHSAVTNDAIVELALALQKDAKLGTDPVADMLLLQMTVQSPKASSDHIQSAEQEEMYLSLNQDIGFLMEQLDKRIGKENYQLLIIGLPRHGSSAETLKKTGIPQRDFNVDRASALVGTYLMALYGHERWVDGGYGQSIFLNKTLIEQKKMSLEVIRRQVSDFLMEFEGVQGACPASDMPLIQGTNEVGRLRQSLSKRTRGDVEFWLEENWRLMQKENVTIDNVVDRSPMVPIILWSGSYRNYPSKEDVSALSIQSLLFE